MSWTMTVKELITELIDYGMDEPVYIGIGPRSIPDDSSDILSVSDFKFTSNITCGVGVYLIPRDDLRLYQPEGFVLVPRCPTESMIDAWDGESSLMDNWTAMLDVAQGGM